MTIEQAAGGPDAAAFLTASRLEKFHRQAEALRRRYQVPCSQVEAGEIVNEAVVVLYEKWDTIRQPERREAWIRGTMKYLVLQALRHQLRAAGTPPLDEDLPVEDNHADRVVTQVAVDRVWAHLRPRQRQVAYLRFMCDYSHAQIAERLVR